LLTFKDSNGGGERHVSAVAEIGTRSISRNGCDAASSLISRAIAARYGCAANCREAVEDEAYAAGAISEATGAIPLLRERLRENEDALARFMLVFDVQLIEPHVTRWWAEFACMDRAAFEQQAADLVRPHGALAALRALAAASTDS
jgi:hypothetical protein